MAKTPQIAVIGSASIDLVTFADRFPKPGETILGQKLTLDLGGKAHIRQWPQDRVGLRC
jgi:ribokinase